MTHSTALSVKFKHLAISISRIEPRQAPLAKERTPESVTENKKSFLGQKITHNYAMYNNQKVLSTLHNPYQL